MADVVVRIGADGSAMTSTLRGLDSRVQSWGNGMKTTFAAIGAGLAAAFSGRALLEAGQSMTKLRAILTTMEGPLGDASAEMDRLKKMAMLPGLNLESAVEGTVRLRAVGMTAEDSRETIAQLANALGLVGGSTEDMKGVVLALGQIQSKGKVFAEEINQINERLPQIRVLMKQAFGTSNTEDLAKMGLTSEQFIKGITEQLKTLPRATDNAVVALKNLGDQFQQTLGVIGVSALKQAEGGINKLIEAFGSLSASMELLMEGDARASTGIRASIMNQIADAEKTFDQARSVEEVAKAYEKLADAKQSMIVNQDQENPEYTQLVKQIADERAKLDAVSQMPSGQERTMAQVEIGKRIQELQNMRDSTPERTGGLLSDDMSAVMDSYSKLLAKFSGDWDESLMMKWRRLEDWMKATAPGMLESLAAFITPRVNKDGLDSVLPKINPRFDLSSAVSSLTRIGGDSGFRFTNVPSQQLASQQRTESEVKKQTPILKSIEGKISKTTATFQ